MSELTHLSHSSFSLYLTCAKAWEFRYVQMAPSLVAPELSFGSAIHDTVEHYLRARSDLEQSVPGMALENFWPEAWNRAIAGREVNFAESGDALLFFEEGIRILRDSEVQKALAGITVLRDAAGPWIERRVELHVPGVPVPVIGYIDFVGADGVPCDLKTANKPWSLDRAANDTQALVYLAALNQAGMTVPDWTFKHLILVKGRNNGRVQNLSWKHDPVDIFFLFETIRGVWQGIQAGVFVTNGQGTWKCAPKWCEYWEHCRGRRA